MATQYSFTCLYCVWSVVCGMAIVAHLSYMVQYQHRHKHKLITVCKHAPTINTVINELICLLNLTTTTGDGGDRSGTNTNFADSIRILISNF